MRYKKKQKEGQTKRNSEPELTPEPPISVAAFKEVNEWAFMKQIQKEWFNNLTPFSVERLKQNECQFCKHIFIGCEAPSSREIRHWSSKTGDFTRQYYCPDCWVTFGVETLQKN